MTSKAGRGGRRYAPLCFTEQGVAMLSSVLKSARAIAINVEIMRTFVRLRQIASIHAELARLFEGLERKVETRLTAQDAAIADFMRAIRHLIEQPGPVSKRPIGFVAEEPGDGGNRTRAVAT